MNNIILTGFMGVGKGKVARALAEKTGMIAIDTDDLIESMRNMKIRKIFARHGEPFFRELEQGVAEWLAGNVRETIVSTGGGFFMTRGFGERDRVVFLFSSLEKIMEKMQAHPRAKKRIKKRPLLADMDRAAELYAQRLPLYRKAADFEVNVEDRDPADIADAIIDFFRLQRRKKR